MANHTIIFILFLVSWLIITTGLFAYFILEDNKLEKEYRAYKERVDKMIAECKQEAMANFKRSFDATCEEEKAKRDKK